MSAFGPRVPWTRQPPNPQSVRLISSELTRGLHSVLLPTPGGRLWDVVQRGFLTTAGTLNTVGSRYGIGSKYGDVSGTAYQRLTFRTGYVQTAGTVIWLGQRNASGAAVLRDNTISGSGNTILWDDGSNKFNVRISGTTTSSVGSFPQDTDVDVCITGDSVNSSFYSNGGSTSPSISVVWNWNGSTFCGLHENTNYSQGVLATDYLWLFYERRLTFAEYTALRANYFQIFAPVERRIWVPAAAGGGTPKTATYSLDMAVQLARTAAASAGLAVQAPSAASASVAAAVRQALSAQGQVDAAVQAAASAQTGLATAIQQGISGAASADVAVQSAQTAGASIDAYIQAATALAASVDIAVQAGFAASAAVDVAVQAAQSASADTSLAVQLAQTASASAGAAIEQARTAAALADAAVQAALSAGVSADLFVQAGFAAAAQFDLAVQHAASAVASVSTAVAQAQAATASVSVVVSLANTLALAAQAAVQASGSAGSAVGLYVFDPTAYTFTVDGPLAIGGAPRARSGAFGALPLKAPTRRIGS